VYPGAEGYPPIIKQVAARIASEGKAAGTHNVGSDAGVYLTVIIKEFHLGCYAQRVGNGMNLGA
jgi:hypothetical protein